MARVAATMKAVASPVMNAPTPPRRRELGAARMGVASDDTKTFDRDRLKEPHTHTTGRAQLQSTNLCFGVPY
jgi:hypothetical protein